MITDPTTTLADAIYRLIAAGLPADMIGGQRPAWIEQASREALAVLAEQGWAVVKLPDADGDDGNNVSWPFASMWHEHRTITTYPRRNHDYTPAEARAMAADLLAAARAAEGGG